VITIPPALSFSERLLDAIPGGLAWLSLVLVIIGAMYAPFVMMAGAAVLATYSSVRFLLAGVADLMGLRLIQRDQNRDWQREYRQRADETSLPLEKVHHVVIIPNYKEDLQTLRATLDRLAEQYNAMQSVSVVLAMESGEPEAIAKGEILKAEYEKLFAHFFVPVHPKGLHNEIQCKSANQAWAARWAKRQLVDELGMDIHHIIVTTMDADTLWHPNYLEALAVKFATDEQRYSAFWQAPIRYHSNVWKIDPFMRLLHGYSSAWELAYLAAPWWQALPMSSYSLSLKLLDNAGYWDSDVIADEWHMFIKAYFKREGNLYLRPIFLPFLASATAGHNIFSSMTRRYRQTLRHAWGAKEIGYALNQILEHPYVPRKRGLQLFFRVAHDNILAGAGWVILSLGTQLPALMHPELVRDKTDTLPFIALQLSFLIVILLSVFFFFMDVRIRPPRPQDSRPTTKERIQSFLSIPLLPTFTLICVAFPVLQAQTQLLAGIPLHFRVTPKT
jgi:hypothetical protein